MEFFDNETNQTQTNITQNSTAPVIYALGPPLASICSVCILIGTLFSVLCLYRYVRRDHLRSHYTYLVSWSIFIAGVHFSVSLSLSVFSFTAC